MPASAQLSVVIPLTDARGDAVDHLRTWTHEQTQSRSDFQVVIVSDGEAPGVDRDVAALLGPHDRFEVVTGGEMIELWNRAAELASTDWLLFTENHVRAETDCIERVIEGIRANPGIDAASIEHGHIIPTATGELGARWFDEVYGEWFQPGQWRRLNLAGFVIRREVHGAVGGHDHRYGLFAAPLLSARLDEREDRIGHFPEARILHVQCEAIGEHHEHSVDYVIGESDARTALPPEFAERYFGYRPLIWNRRAMSSSSARHACALLARELLRSLRHRRAERWLLRALARRVPDAIAGVGARRRLAELRFRWTEWLADSRWIPRRVRYRAYLRAQDAVTRLAQLRWIEQRSDGAPAAIEPGGHTVESIGEGALVGVHGLELQDGRWFRWSEPVLTLSASTPAAGEMRIDTGGLRGSPLSGVAAAYRGSRRLSRTEIREEGDELVVSLPGGSAELTLLCRPLPGGGTTDQRELGLPIFSIELDAPEMAPGPAALQEPATIA